MKELNCKDVGMNCGAKITGETENEIMAKAGEHARKEHGMLHIPVDLVDKVKGAIKEVGVEKGERAAS